MDEIKQIADRVFGDPEALTGVDSVLVMQVVEYIHSVPALGKVASLALAAIVALSESKPDYARSLLVELRG